LGTQVKAPYWDHRQCQESQDAFAAICDYLGGSDGRLDKVPEKTVLEWLAKTLNGSMVHSHQATCKKNHCLGTDESCRMDFPRLLVDESYFLNDHSFLLRRNHGKLVPFCSAWMRAIPGNHMFSLIPEQSRQVRAEYLYKRMMTKFPEGEVREWGHRPRKPLRDHTRL